MIDKPLKYSCGVIEFINEIKKLYRSGQIDYALEPIIRTDKKGNFLGPIKDGDAVIFCCQRGEREVQLTRAFVDPEFKEFPILKFQDLRFITLTLYHEMFLKMPVGVAFPPLSQIKDNLGETISQNGFRQLRVAESEKFAHVTFFLNGGHNRPYPGEDHVRVPSPRKVSFEHVPQLSTAEVVKKALEGIGSGEYAFIVVNFADGDMIGHFENRESKIKCAEALDKQLGNLLKKALPAGYLTLITADHGILEMGIRPDGTPNASHTHNPVPFVVIDSDTDHLSGLKLRTGGKLADIAPTVLQILGLPKPNLMTGKSLLKNHPLKYREKKVLLIILDGWGLGQEDESNPIFLAETPVWERLLHRYPFTSLKAAGRAVGLLDWKAGNSEAGHVNIGAGRVVPQDDVRINQAIEDGSFYRNPAFLEAVDAVKGRKKGLHLIGLLSEKSSHGSIRYPLALLRLARERRLEEVYLHVIFDGRSTKIRNAPELLEKMFQEMKRIGIGKMVTGVGRSLALDRNEDYQKTQSAYDAFVFGQGRRIKCK